MKRERGITLIALVITIVILIILAVVAINLAFGEGGLIKRAEQAGEYYANDTDYTGESIANVEKYMEEILAKNNAKLWDQTKVTTTVTEDNKYVPVPKGYVVSKATGETKVNEGLVIYEGTEEVNDGNVETARKEKNQYVWIPVTNTDLLEMYEEGEGTELATALGVKLTTNVYSKDRSSVAGFTPEGEKAPIEPDILTSEVEGDAVTGNSEKGIEQIKSVFGYEGTDAEVLEAYGKMLVEEYTNAYESIKTYGGFYIGRYELTGSIDNPTVRKDGEVIGFQSWYNLYKACSKVAENEYVQSTMISGNQWDELMDWLIDTGAKSEEEINKDSRTWGNYKDSVGEAAEGSGAKRTAGYNEAWKANNIYDIAGNVSEWTLKNGYSLSLRRRIL